MTVGAIEDVDFLSDRQKGIDQYGKLIKLPELLKDPDLALNLRVSAKILLTLFPDPFEKSFGAIL